MYTFIIVFKIILYLYFSLSVCKGHRFIVDTGAPFHSHGDHDAKQALKMQGFIRYITCYSLTVDCPIILHFVPLHILNLNLPLS
jgi:hypothetical protein